MDLATFIRQWCTEHGRSLEYQLPDGSSVPLADDELADILAGIRFSPYVSASALFRGSEDCGVRTKVRHRPGPSPKVQRRIQEEARAGIAQGEFTAEQLKKGNQAWLEKRFRAHHTTIERALAQLF